MDYTPSSDPFRIYARDLKNYDKDIKEKMNKINLVVSSLTLVASAASFNASAWNPFADCGIGAALFPTTKWAAVTSNVVWDIGITALVSGTASPETCNGKTLATAKFIIDNYDKLAENIAEGQGEYLSALYQVIDLKEEEHQKATLSIRQKMVTNITSSGYQKLSLVEKSSSLYKVVTESTAKVS
jgi:hypothetical protein